jgi:hypothetical protein
MQHMLQASPAITMASAGNHVVGIEPMTAELSNGARAAVVERYNGKAIKVITTDNDDFRRAPMEEVAAFYAHWANASVAPAVWLRCPHCDAPDDLCLDLFTHLRMSASNEMSWR